MLFPSSKLAIISVVAIKFACRLIFGQIYIFGFNYQLQIKVIFKGSVIRVSIRSLISGIVESYFSANLRQRNQY